MTYNADRKEFMQANIRYFRKSLHFIFYSLDETNDYEIAPVASFDPTLPDRSKLYVFQQTSGMAHNVNSGNVATPDASEEQFGAYMQGVHDDSLIFNLSPMQIGVLLTFALPMKGYILRHGPLLMFRRSFGIIIKKLISVDLSDEQINGWTSLLTTLPYMLLQCEKSRPDVDLRQKLYLALQREDVLSIKASDFKRKSLRSKKLMDKKRDFTSRRHKQADKNVMSGDYARAMQALLRVNSRVNLDEI